jgi:hypothetical protein
MKQNYLKNIYISLAISTLATIILPVIANAETQAEFQAETKILKFVRAVGFPESIKAIKTGSTYNAVVWNYPHAINGKDMYILFEDGQPKSVSIDGKIVLSAKDG